MTDAPIKIARTVRGYEEGDCVVIHHDEDPRFTEETPDIEWLAKLQEDGEPLWIVISGDGRILRNMAERAVLDAARLPFFCLDKRWQHTSIEEYAWKFMKVWPKIKAAAEAGPGSIFKITAGTSLHVESIK